MEKIAKPKLVFFQCRADENLPSFMALHRQQHVKCLSEFFEVAVIRQDCDYQQICDHYQPDLTLFENAGNILECHRLEIENTRVYPEIPKLGLLNTDAWCNSRAVFLSDMERWGVETFFSICTTAAEHTPEIAENLFVWSNFIDAETYRDYGTSKVIPVLFTGANYDLYPWRQKITKRVSQHYPSLICPHLGYGGRSTARMLYGEKYARALNASWFVPTCGTIAKEIVRKHFEIPASKACLITEKSSALEAAGFVDMQNCVFADEDDVLDKLDYLFQNQDELESIIDAGYQLVHSQHTLKHRDQIFQWFNLHKNLQPHQTIIQTSPFEPLTVVEKSSGIRNSHIQCNGLNLVLLRQGDEKLQAGRYDEAETLYFKCLNHVGIMHEPKLRLALCNLYKGDAMTALEWIVPLSRCMLEIYQAYDPDPVEWAYFIISLLCLGKLGEATKRCSEFPWLHHDELDRVRWIVNLLRNEQHQCTPLPSTQLKLRASIHHLPNRNLSEWIENLRKMLIACGQLDFAEALKTIAPLDAQLSELGEEYLAGSSLESLKHAETVQNISSKALPNTLRTRSARASVRTKIGKKFFNKIKKATRKMLYPLNRLETKFGYFLPFHISEMRNDEFFQSIANLVEKEEIKTVLLIGASLKEGITAAAINAIQKRTQNITMFCVNNFTPRITQLQRRYVNDSRIKCYQLPSNPTDSLITDIKDCIKKIKLENEIIYFDIILIDNSEAVIQNELNYDEFYGAEFIALDNINTFQGYKNYNHLVEKFGYTLEAHNPHLRGGYAVFKKIS